MHHTIIYYSYFKPLGILHVPPRFQIQHLAPSSYSTLPHMQMQNLKLWGIQHMDQMANFCQTKMNLPRFFV